MDSGRLLFNSAVPCRSTSAGGGGQMLLFGGGGGFPGGAPVVAGVEDGRRKRPFLTTLQEELQLDHELYGSFDQQAPERKRRLTAEQVLALERSFEEEKRKLEPERKSELARRLGMAPRQVAVWFQNRRARWRAKQLEQDFDHLKADHDELLAGRDALLADNDRLRSQVISLTEKLQAKDESPASEPDEQTAASATHATAALGSVQFEEGHLCTETTNGWAVPAPPRPRLARGANDSPESYFAGARSPPSSSDDDCGGKGCTFFLPDAMLDVVAVEHGRTEEEGEAQLTNWAWLWN